MEKYLLIMMLLTAARICAEVSPDYAYQQMLIQRAKILGRPEPKFSSSLTTENPEHLSSSTSITKQSYVESSLDGLQDQTKTLDNSITSLEKELLSLKENQ